MVIVQGVFRVDPAERDAYLAQSVETMLASRSEHGCVEYVVAADPVEPDRVILSERWASQDDLDEHLRSLTRKRAEGRQPAGVEVLSLEIYAYEVASERKMA